jgi:hypothetical protein
MKKVKSFFREYVEGLKTTSALMYGFYFNK